LLVYYFIKDVNGNHNDSVAIARLMNTFPLIEFHLAPECSFSEVGGRKLKPLFAALGEFRTAPIYSY
jgi:hypothetical protein